MTKQHVGRRKLAARLAIAGVAVATTAAGTAAASAPPDTVSDATASDATVSDATVSDATVSAEGSGPDGTSGASGITISDERCAENEAAGTITYLSSFDFAAAAGIVDVVVADANGYFEALCLDVDMVPSFSTANYTLIAAGEGQFSAAGSYTEILNNTAEGAEFLALVDYGKTPIEALITPDGGATTLEELEGSTVGVKGDLPPSVVAMLAGAGLERGSDYDEVLLDGFDPVVHLESGIDALPVYKSNEPGQLDAQGIAYNIFDPVDFDIPGTFGILYTSASFAEEHPTAVEDFIRASLQGMADAIADPEAAAQVAFEAIEAAGNQNYLVLEGETFRWQAESAEVIAGTPEGDPIGLIDPDLFQAEYDAYVDAGVWPDGAPEFGEYFDAELAASLYDENGEVVWPD
ncbi:ABC transporter substrate-binding protein [Desertimonas flava]|uniref:ABC transporter substrate-binding protein n=1 Tax=Desertimonas flava TaxID=2064846 RepID=UPI000E355C2D|nr:ABC transporter substrate-binding protein [Desertimonas flava]